MDYKNICSQVCLLAKEVGKYIKNEQLFLTTNRINSKGVHDFVTDIDKTAEQKIVSALQKILPFAGFITEEETIPQSEKECIWIVDPLDGTTNYIHGLPIFAISIALMVDNEIVVGVVYEIGRNECFYAWKGSNAYLNNDSINVSITNSLEKSLLATGFPYTNFSRLPQYMDFLMYTLQHTSGVRRLGSAATDLAYVACGRLDGFYEYGLKPWDVAAGSFIVQQAGGKNADFSGNSNYIFGEEIVSSNNFIFDSFLTVCSKFLSKK